MAEVTMTTNNIKLYIVLYEHLYTIYYSMNSILTPNELYII